MSAQPREFEEIDLEEEVLIHPNPPGSPADDMDVEDELEADETVDDLKWVQTCIRILLKDPSY